MWLWGPGVLGSDCSQQFARGAPLGGTEPQHRGLRTGMPVHRARASSSEDHERWRTQRV